MLMVDAETEYSQRYLGVSGFVMREIAGEFLLIPVTMQEDAESRIVVLNESSKFLWEQLQQPRSIAQLVQAMTEEYEVSEAQARGDILEFVNYLTSSQLLMRVEEKI